MRVLIAGLAMIAIASCTPPTANGPSGESGARGYTLEVRADEGQEVYIVTAPNGDRIAGRTSNGTSALLSASDINQLADVPEPPPATGPNDVSLRAPGFSLQASGEDNEKGGHGRVSMSIGGVQIDASGDDFGGDEHANVRIAGVSASDARDFINDAEHLSDEVKAQMIAALEL